MTSEPLVPFPRLDELQGATPDSWDGAMTSSLVLPRRAHSVPTRLYTATERETAAAAAPGSEAQASSLPDDVPEIYREMEAAEREAAANTPERQALTRLRGAIWVRYALESTDIKPADAARRSAWYQEHGLDAGREVVPRLLSVGDASDRLELFPDRDQRDDPAWIQKKDRRSSGIASGSGGMSSLPERPNWLSSAARGRGGRRAAMDNLDEELDSLQAARESSSGAPGGSDDLLDGSRSTSRWGHDGYESRGRGSRRSNGAGGKAAMDALDEELDALNSRNRARSSSPARVGSGSSGRNNEQVRIRGRGAMRAPTSTWDDVDGDDAMRVGSGNFRGRMVADDLYPENHSRGGRGRGGRRRGGDRWEDDDAPAGAAGLADRLSPANGASSLEARLSDRLGGSGSGSLSGRLAPREGGEGSLAARFS